MTFELTDRRPLAIFDGEYRAYRHVAFGTRHIHVAGDDETAAFGLAFATPTYSDSGIAHVVEHLVGWGSQRSVGRHAFFDLMQGSLQSFLNGFTGPGWTMFTFCTPSEADYRLLADAHLDAALHARLDAGAFEREQRVVANEMTGGRASIDHAMERALGAALAPKTPYAHDYGGVPELIAELDLASVRAFHQAHYHPGNAVLYTCGAIDERAIQDLADAAFSGMSVRPATARPVPPPPAAPVVDHYQWRGAVGDPTPHALLGWMKPTTSEPGDDLLFRAAADALMVLPGAPVPRAVAGVGPAFPRRGAHFQIDPPVAAIGARGAGAELVAVRDAALSAAADGIEPAALAAALDRRERNHHALSTEGLPHPLALLHGALDSLLAGRDPYDVLSFDAAAAQIRSNLSASAERAAAWFADSPHRAAIAIEPMPVPHAPVTPPAPPRQSGVAPAPHPVDASSAARIVAPEVDRLDDRASWVGMRTGRVAHLAIRADLTRIPAPESMLAALQASAIAAPAICELDIGCAADDPTRVVATATFRTSALARTPEQLWGYLARSVPLQRAVPALRARAQAQLRMRGVRYACILAAAAVSPVGALEERLSGFAYLRWLRTRELSGAASLPLDQSAHIALAGPLGDPRDVQALVRTIRDQLPPTATSLEPVSPIPAHEPGCRVIAVPGGVANNAQVYAAPAFANDDSPAALVLAHYLRIAHLHAAVRERGGAYGVDALYLPRRGLLTLWSASDPHIDATYAAFDQAVDAVIDGRVDAAALSLAVVSATRQILAPRTVAQRMTAAAFDPIDGHTAPLEQRYLARLTTTSAAEVIRAAQTYLVGPRGRATVAGAAMLERSRPGQCIPVGQG